MKYQLIYKLNSKTHYSFLESDTFQNVKNLFKNLCVGELTEIREVLEENKTVKKDDKNYIHSATVKISSYDRKNFRSIKIPKFKKNLDENSLINIVKKYIKLNSSTPDNVQISKLYKS